MAHAPYVLRRVEIRFATRPLQGPHLLAGVYNA